jgi:hypothetical protein
MSATVNPLWRSLLASTFWLARRLMPPTRRHSVGRARPSATPEIFQSQQQPASGRLEILSLSAELRKHFLVLRAKHFASREHVGPDRGHMVRGVPLTGREQLPAADDLFKSTKIATQRLSD